MKVTQGRWLQPDRADAGAYNLFTKMPHRNSYVVRLYEYERSTKYELATTVTDYSTLYVVSQRESCKQHRGVCRAPVVHVRLQLYV